MESLYDNTDKALMRNAEMARMPGKNRVEEIRNFALNAGVKKIGVGHCIMFQKEADTLKHMLGDEFEVITVDCKVGKMPSSTFVEGATGISCNPAAQAQILADHRTEINISMGLCVGHDMVFGLKSKVPTTTLLVKDREHKHNPMQTFQKM